MINTEYELEALLSLDGCEFRFEEGYWVKIEAQRVAVTRSRPYGVKYSLTLHDPEVRRIYGLDNAHAVGRHVGYDHRHVYGVRKVVLYTYNGAAQLLVDFYREVERILKERGIR